jgi:hypothetical protein
MDLGRLIVVAAWIAFAPALLLAQSSSPKAADEPLQWRNLALDRALTAANAISQPYRRAQALASIARTQTLIAERAADKTIHQALAAAREVPEPAFRDWALYEIVLAQIAADDFIGARETANRIETRRQRSAALAALADVQLRAGNLKAVQATVDGIREPGTKGEVLRQIVVVQASRGELSAARATLADIDDPFYYALAAGDVAIAEVRSGRIDRAHAMAARTRRADRAKVYARVAIARADAGDLRGATETMQKVDDEFDRAIVQGRIAAAQAIAGNSTAARELFAATIAGLGTPPDQTERSVMALAQVARLQTVSGDAEAAKEPLRLAMQNALRLPAGEDREETLDYIARGQARAGDTGGALQTALKMTDRVARALLVRDVVTLHADASDAAAAAKAAAFEDPLTEAAAQFGVLGVQLLKSKATLSPITIDAARAAVHKLEETQLKPAAFAAIAAARARIGDVEGGASIFQEALAAADQITNTQQRAAAYVDVVTALNDRLMFLGRPAPDDAANADR